MKKQEQFLLLIIALASWTFIYMSYFKENSSTTPVYHGKINRADPPFQKPFIYLTETESCLPPNLAIPLGNASTCNCDVIVLSFRTPCKTKKAFAPHISYLLDPKTTWVSGRNVLFFAALDRRPGYQYYIFLNDDTRVKFNKFTPPGMAATLQPFRAIEKWLLDYEPAVGVLDYSFHNGADVHFKRRRILCGINETSLVVPVIFFDAIFNAFHYKAITHILPYREEYEYESWYHAHKNVISNAEIKFRGQVLMFTAAIASNPKHRSYPKRSKTISKLEVWRRWIEEAQRLAPIEHRNNSLFEKMLDQPWTYSTVADTLCMNATKHQPIVPYAQFLDN